MNKIFLIFFIIITIFFGTITYKIVSDKYDKQNKIIIIFKGLVPEKLKNSLRTTVYEIRSFLNSEEEENLIKIKQEQGLRGKLIKNEIFRSKEKNEKFRLKEFFLPFKRLDLTYGWAASDNSKRAHYFEVIGDNIIAISGEGKTIYFEKKNFENNELNQKIIKNNLNKILEQNNSELIGIRDLYFENNKLFISMLIKDKNGYTFNIYEAEKNFKKLTFKLFFKTNEYVSDYSIGTGGRIEKFSKDRLLLTIGHLGKKNAPQNKSSLAGKIIAINKLNKNYELISLGHRNPQGLFYHEEKNLVINSEHGPKGGDEININNLISKKIPNYGWDIASYGIEYDGSKPYKTSHAEHGFVEPLKYFTPSVGISQIYVKSKNDLNEIFISSLRAGSIYKLTVDEKFQGIISLDRIMFSQRIRDLSYDEDLNGFIILFENIPSIGFLKSI